MGVVHRLRLDRSEVLGRMAETGSRGVDVEGGGRGDENPFSFKSFVKRASTGGPGAEGEQGKGGKRERGRGRKARPATTLSSEGDVPFPEEGEGTEQHAT